jgi:hypothetical protein
MEGEGRGEERRGFSDNIVVRRLEGNRSHGRSRHRWENNTKIYVSVVRYECMSLFFVRLITYDRIILHLTRIRFSGLLRYRITF